MTQCARLTVEKKFSDPKFCDTIFYVGEDRTPICVIGSYLAMHSEYFEKLIYNPHFKQSSSDINPYPHISKEFYEPDVKPETFEYIVRFCHLMEDIKDKDSIHTNNVFPLLYASQKYLLNEISDQCKQYININASQSAKTLLEFLCKSVSYGLTCMTQDLKEKLKNHISTGDDCNDLLNSEAFLSLPLDIVLEYFVKNGNCNVKEEILFERCVEYCKVNTAKMDSLADADLQSKNKKVSFLNSEQSVDQSTIYENKENEEKQQNITTSRDQRTRKKSRKFSPWKLMMRKIFLYEIRFPIMDGVYITQQLPKFKLLTKDETITILSQFANKNFRANGVSLFPLKIRGIINIRYKLTMSTKYSKPDNTYDALISDDTTRGAGTNKGDNEWIQASFDKMVNVKQVEVAGAKGMDGTWDCHHLNGSWLQYMNIDHDWTDIIKLVNVENKIKCIDVNVQTTSIRIVRKHNGYLGTGRFKIKGIKICN